MGIFIKIFSLLFKFIGGAVKGAAGLFGGKKKKDEGGNDSEESKPQSNKTQPSSNEEPIEDETAKSKAEQDVRESQQESEKQDAETEKSIDSESEEIEQDLKDDDEDLPSDDGSKVNKLRTKIAFIDRRIARVQRDIAETELILTDPKITTANAIKYNLKLRKLKKELAKLEEERADLNNEVVEDDPLATINEKIDYIVYNVKSTKKALSKIPSLIKKVAVAVISLKAIQWTLNKVKDAGRSVKKGAVAVIKSPIKAVQAAKEITPAGITSALFKLILAINIFKVFTKGKFSNITDFVVGAIKFIVDILVKFIPKALEWLLKLIIGLLGGLAQIIKKAVEIIKTLFGAVLDATPGLITTIVDGITKLLPTLGNFFKELFQVLVVFFQEVLPEIWSGICSIASQIWNFLQKYGPAALEWVVATLAAIFDLLFDKWIPAFFHWLTSDAIPYLLDILSRVVNWLKGFIPKALAFLKNLYTIVYNKAIAVIPKLLNKIVELGKSILTWLAKQLPKILKWVVNDLIPALVKLIINQFLNVAKLFTAIVKWAAKFIRYLSKHLPAIVNWIVNATVNFVRMIASKLPSVFKWIFTEFLPLLWELIKALVPALWDLLVSLLYAAVQILWALVKGIVTLIWETIKGIWDAIKWVVGILGKIFSEVVKIVGNVVKFIWKYICWLKDWIVWKINPTTTKASEPKRPTWSDVAGSKSETKGTSPAADNAVSTTAKEPEEDKDKSEMKSIASTFTSIPTPSVDASGKVTISAVPAPKSNKPEPVVSNAKSEGQVKKKDEKVTPPKLDKEVEDKSKDKEEKKEYAEGTPNVSNSSSTTIINNVDNSSESNDDSTTIINEGDVTNIINNSSESSNSSSNKSPSSSTSQVRYYSNGTPDTIVADGENATDDNSIEGLPKSNDIYDKAAQVASTISESSATAIPSSSTEVSSSEVGPNGTHPGGPAIVGDGGEHEVIVDPENGVSITPDTPTLIPDLPRGTTVIPEHKISGTSDKSDNTSSQVRYYSNGTPSAKYYAEGTPNTSTEQENSDWDELGGSVDLESVGADTSSKGLESATAAVLNETLNLSKRKSSKLNLCREIGLLDVLARFMYPIENKKRIAKYNLEKFRNLYRSLPLATQLVNRRAGIIEAKRGLYVDAVRSILYTSSSILSQIFPNFGSSLIAGVEYRLGDRSKGKYTNELENCEQALSEVDPEIRNIIKQRLAELLRNTGDINWNKLFPTDSSGNLDKALDQEYNKGIGLSANESEAGIYEEVSADDAQDKLEKQYSGGLGGEHKGVFKSKSEFIRTLYNEYVAQGVNPVIAQSMVAQSALESAWGTSHYAQYSNYGGINYGKDADYAVPGKSAHGHVKAGFNNVSSYVRHKLAILNRNFPGAVNAQDAAGYFKILQGGNPNNFYYAGENDKQRREYAGIIINGTLKNVRKELTGSSGNTYSRIVSDDGNTSITFDSTDINTTYTGGGKAGSLKGITPGDKIELVVKRQPHAIGAKQSTPTYGKLYVNGQYFSDTYENAPLDPGSYRAAGSKAGGAQLSGKAQSATATKHPWWYWMRNTINGLFGRNDGNYIPWVNTYGTGRDGIRIHPSHGRGNGSEGCLTLGINKNQRFDVEQSKALWKALLPYIYKAGSFRIRYEDPTTKHYSWNRISNANKYAEGTPNVRSIDNILIDNIDEDNPREESIYIAPDSSAIDSILTKSSKEESTYVNPESVKVSSKEIIFRTTQTSDTKISDKSSTDSKSEVSEVKDLIKQGTDVNKGNLALTTDILGTVKATQAMVQVIAQKSGTQTIVNPKIVVSGENNSDKEFQ